MEEKYYYHDLNEIPNDDPYIRMVIEPETKYRFRYQSEGGSHGGLAGRERINKKKTYPTVKLVNYNGSSKDIFIRVSLFTENKTEHVLLFKGKKSSGCKMQKYMDYDLDENFCVVFKDLTILIPKKEDVYQALLDLKIKSQFGRNVSKREREKFEKENKEDIKKEAKEIFNSVILKFDIYEYARPDVQICPSLYSDPICNQKDSSKGELKICRMSKVTGSCKGDEEVILLCEKVQKDNVKIKFYERDGNDNRWEAYATFSPSDVHYQVAIPFRTPPYTGKTVGEETTVDVCLERGGEMSKPVKFKYIPEDYCPPNKRKRCGTEEALRQMSSPMDGSPSSSAGAVPDNMIGNSEGFSWANLSFQEILQSPLSDSNSSSQQDQDCPSNILGSDFLKLNQLDLASLLSDTMNDFVDHDFKFEEPVNQSLLWEGQMDEEENYIPQSLPMMDSKIEELMAVMDIKDSESNDEIPIKISKKVPKSKIFKDEQKKLEKFLPYIANKDKDGNTLLHLAVIHNKSIKKILQVIKMSKSDVINAQNNKKKTALHIAVKKNSGAVKELLENSANPSIKNAKGDNCCHIACQHNLVNCLEYMLFPRRCSALILQETNDEGLTPLHIAFKNNSVSCLDFLFRQCYNLIDFSALDLKLGQSFLHYAVEYLPSYVSHLINEEEIEINCRDYNGNTPLHIASAKGNCEVVKQLMEAGADPGIRNSKHNGSSSEEEDSSDEAPVGQTPADLTTDSVILNLLESVNTSDGSDSVTNEDKESDRIFEELVKNLSSLLDPDMRWKDLAMYVLDEEYVTGLEKCSQNPTKNILEYMKKTLGDQYIEQLIGLLEMIGFDDAVKVTNESCKQKVTNESCVVI